MGLVSLLIIILFSVKKKPKKTVGFKEFAFKPVIYITAGNTTVQPNCGLAALACVK